MTTRGRPGHVEPVRTAEHARPDHFLLHLSDTHLLSPGGSCTDRVAAGAQPPAHLRRPRGLGHPAGGDRLHRGPRGPRRGRGVPASCRASSSRPPSASARRSSGAWATTTTAATFRQGLFGQVGSAKPGRPRLRRATASGSSPSTPPCPATTRRALRRPARLAGGGAGQPGAARHDPRAAPPAAALHPGPRRARSSCATSTSSARCVEGSDVRSILAGHLHFSTNGTSPASPSRSRRRPATRRT